MPLPLLALGAGAVALLALAKKRPAAPQVGPGTALAPAPAKTPGDIAALAGGALAAAAGAAVALGQVGAAVDKALNPNSNTASQVTAGVALGGTAALTVLAAFGVLGISFPIVGIFFAVAAAIYFAFVGIQDLVRLGYGQRGAREDFAKQYWQIYDAARLSIRGNDANQHLTDAQMDRQLIPLCEGFMARLNWSAYQAWMQKKNVTVKGYPDDSDPDRQSGIPAARLGKVFPGSDSVCDEHLLWHFNFAVDRGYIVADADGMRALGGPTPQFDSLFEPFTRSPRSKQQSFVLGHTPEGELVKTQTGTVEGNTAFFENVWTTVLSNPLFYRPPPPPPAPPTTVTPIFSYSDPQRGKYFEGGWTLGDFSLYKKVATDCKGDFGTMLAAKNAYVFEGDLQPDGSLSYRGVTAHWRDLSSIPGAS